MTATGAVPGSDTHAAPERRPLPRGAPGRSFLLLQGPHGPFFGRLGAQLEAAGCQVRRVGFNRGDQIFWPRRESYIPWTGTAEDWPAGCERLMEAHGITDLVLYGDTRPVHAEAIRLARARGIVIHIFEEGYLRPYWITYERGGSNGNSRLMTLGLDEMRAALSRSEEESPEVPAVWGDLRQHIFYGAVYHFFVMTLNQGYPGFRPHRAIPVFEEFRLYLKRLLLMPLHRFRRWRAERRIRSGGMPYHLVLLQLEHDSSFRMHSPFGSMTEFIRLILEGFVAGAPQHHHLVFKAHPLEDGRAGLEPTLRQEAARLGLSGRVHYTGGGKLAALLGHARTAVTVNSTAAQQALWRGLPVRAFGRAVYEHPEFLSDQPLAGFFRAPRRPDLRAYRDYRRFLLETSQLVGGYYSSEGRQAILRQVTDLMLAEEDPYDALLRGSAPPRQHLRLIG